MEISKTLPKQLLRYFSKPIFLSSFSSLTLKYLPLLLSRASTCLPFYLDSIHRTLSFCSSLTGSSSYWDSHLDTNEKKPSLHDSCGGLLSNCHLVSIPVHTSYVCKSLYGLSSNFHFVEVSSQFSKSVALFYCYSRYCCATSSSHSVRSPENGCLSRMFSASFCHAAMPSDKTGESGVILNQLDCKSKRTHGIQTRLSLELKLKIIDVIGRGEDDMESKLSLIASNLSVESSNEIFQILNCQRMSGFRFFRWLRGNNPQLRLNARICSLIINNCGWLDDYDTMGSLLNEFREEGICLSYEAFGFLSVLGSSQASLLNLVSRLINLLNGVGGSCRTSGISALVEMFCRLELLDMVKHIMKMTDKKESHFVILIRQKLNSGNWNDVHGIVNDMWQCGCEPTIKTYNYLLSSLCKNGKMPEACCVLEKIKDKGVIPNALTFEFFIHSACARGQVDVAKNFLDMMLKRNLEPRLQSHAAIIKALFKSKQSKEALKYVMDSSVKYKCSSSKIYSLLAGLHLSKGDLTAAQGILLDMMDKGHKPDFEVYIRILKKLRTTHCSDLARDLKRFLFVHTDGLY